MYRTILKTLRSTAPRYLQCHGVKSIAGAADKRLAARVNELQRIQREKNDLMVALQVAQASGSRDPKVAHRKAVALIENMFDSGALDWESLEQATLAGQHLWAWRQSSFPEVGRDQATLKQPVAYEIYDPRVWKSIEARYLAWVVNGRSQNCRFVEVDVAGENLFYHYETVDFKHMEQRPSLAAHGHMSTPSPAMPRSLKRLAISELTETQMADHAQRIRRAIAEKEEAIRQKKTAVEEDIPVKLLLEVPVANEGHAHSLGRYQHMEAIPASLGYPEDEIALIIEQLEK